MMKSKSTFLLSALTCATLLAPAVINAVEWQLTDEKQQELKRMQSEYDYPAIVKAYVEFMIKHGRDRYGKQHTPLFMTVLNRKTGNAFNPPYPRVITKPYAPGLRRDHKMRPYDRTYQGSNPLEDIPLYELLYRFMATTLQDAAAHVEKRDPELAGEMREFARFMDDEYLSNEYDKILDVAGKGIMAWYRGDLLPGGELALPGPDHRPGDQGQGAQGHVVDQGCAGLSPAPGFPAAAVRGGAVSDPKRLNLPQANVCRSQAAESVGE